jgi:hypothetical protein
MVRRLLTGFLLFCAVSLVVAAQEAEAPALMQPAQAGYSTAQQAALSDALTRLQGTLANTQLGSKRTLGENGWTRQTFAGYTAGTLERLGYHTAIVSAQRAGGETWVWVVVRIDLAGATAWIPVESLPDVDSNQRNLGRVPLAATLVYDPAYLIYDTVVNLPPNLPPTAVIHSPLSDVVEHKADAWFSNRSTDPDGEIVLFQWTFGDSSHRPSQGIAEWHTFDEGGREYTVQLTVTDSRGAQATAYTTVYVLTTEEYDAKSCGCGAQ